MKTKTRILAAALAAFVLLASAARAEHPAVAVVAAHTRAVVVRAGVRLFQPRPIIAVPLYPLSEPVACYYRAAPVYYARPPAPELALGSRAEPVEPVVTITVPVSVLRELLRR